MNKISTTFNGDKTYEISILINFFQNIIKHYYNNVEPFEIDGCGNK